jgi:hypothetical protein
VRDTQRTAQGMAILVLLFPSRFAGAFDTIRHHLHGPLQRNRLPFLAARRAVQNLLLALRTGHKLECALCPDHYWVGSDHSPGVAAPPMRLACEKQRQAALVIVSTNLLSHTPQ